MSERMVICASDVMHDDFIEVDGMLTVLEVLKLMDEKQVNVVLVRKRDQHDAHGIVLLNDIAKRVLAKDRSPERVNVYEIMTKPIISLPPELDVRYCARLFNQFGLSVAPVIDQGSILGVVGYRELIFQGLMKLHQSG